MATINGLTKEAMEAIRDGAIVEATVVGDNLILTLFDESTVDAGNVRGPVGNGPIGTIIDYISETPPSASWLGMWGQTVANAQTLYTTLWGIIPGSMKLGSSMIMPDTRGRVAVGWKSSDPKYNSIGEIGGEEAHELTSAEMPAHVHVVDAPPALLDRGDGNGLDMSNPGFGLSALQLGTVDAASVRHAFVDIPIFNTTSTGFGAPHSNIQPYVVFSKMLKVL